MYKELFTTKTIHFQKGGRHVRRSVTGPEDARTARQSLPLKTFYKTFGKNGELKELSESTVHRKIMFPDIVQIQCVKKLYRDLISINIYFAFFSFLFKYNV